MFGWTVLVFNTFWCRDGYAGNARVSSIANRTSTCRFVLRDKAFSIFGTWILVEARIYTVLASACLVQGTFRILSTSDNFTSYKWISFIAGDTPTHCFVAGWVAFGKSTTGVLHQARVDTVAINTHISISAVVVALTADWLAGNLRVSDISWRTNTDWTVVFHETLCSRSTITRVKALSVDTSLSIWTIVISCTTWFIWQFYRFTLRVCVRHPSFSA